MKKKALISSILTIALCLSLIAGSTFALFTSESTVNVAVTSGKVDVKATIKEDSIQTKQLYDQHYTAGLTYMFNAEVELDGGLKISKMVPGDAIKFAVTITNNSNVGIKYRTVLKADGDVELLEALKVTVEGLNGEYDGSTIKTDWKDWTDTDTTKTVEVVIEFPDADNNNDYQDLDCTLYYTVEAVQGNADMPDEWDGVTVTAPTKDSETGIYHITNANEFVYYITDVLNGINSGHDYVLDKDIDLGGYTITFSDDDSRVLGSNFDGQNHTVSNFTLKGDKMFVSLFGYTSPDHADRTVKNLTVRNATVVSTKAQAAVILAAANTDNGTYVVTVDNCKVYDSVIIGNKKVAPVVGYTEGGTITNCYAENCNVYCADTRADQAGEVVGYINTSEGLQDNTSNNTSENVTVTLGASYVADGVVLNAGTYEIYNANGMFWFASQAENIQCYADVKLIADIDLENKAWTPIANSRTQYNGTFDGNGHTIYNLKVTAPADAGENEATGLFAWTNGTIKNLTIDGADVVGNHWVGALVGHVQAGTIENCTVKNAKVTSQYANSARDGDKAGAIVGYLNCGDFNPTIKDCAAENCQIQAVRDAGQIVGCAKDVNVTGCTATNVTVTGSGANINNSIIGRIAG